MAEVQAESVRRRRRKSSRRKPVTWREYWRSAEFGRHLFVAMGLIGAAYAGTVLWETRFASYHYPPVKIGMTPSEVRYLLGSPRAVEDGGSVYRYSETVAPGSRTTARAPRRVTEGGFSPNQRKARLRK